MLLGGCFCPPVDQIYLPLSLCAFLFSLSKFTDIGRTDLTRGVNEILSVTPESTTQLGLERTDSMTEYFHSNSAHVGLQAFVSRPPPVTVLLACVRGFPTGHPAACSMTTQGFALDGMLLPKVPYNKLVRSRV